MPPLSSLLLVESNQMSTIFNGQNLTWTRILQNAEDEIADASFGEKSNLAK